VEIWAGLSIAPATRAMLAEIYRGFSEGFDTNDLKEAQGFAQRIQGLESFDRLGEQ
jgi:hypothetical protein